VADAESDQQRVCVDLLGMRPEGNGYDRPHDLLSAKRKTPNGLEVHRVLGE